MVVTFLFCAHTYLCITDEKAYIRNAIWSVIKINFYLKKTHCMKKIFLAASLLIAAASVTGISNANAATITAVAKKGQHIPASEVPAPVMASFNANFPTATNVKWEKEREDSGLQYQADFTQNGVRWRARFAKNGTLLNAGPR